MKKTIVFSLLAIVSPFTLANTINLHPLEQCGIGSTCSYNVAGHSQRIISIAELQAKKIYSCNPLSGNGKHFTVGYVSSSNGARIEEGPSGDLRSAFTLYGPAQNKGSITFLLRNNDLWGMEHSIRFHCAALN